MHVLVVNAQFIYEDLSTLIGKILLESDVTNDSDPK